MKRSSDIAFGPPQVQKIGGACPLCQGPLGAHHTLPNDPGLHPICVNTATRCPACNTWFCNALCLAGHVSALDANGHPFCANAPATQCPACNGWYCNAQCIAGHASALDANGHPCCANAPATQCPACNGLYCNAQCIAAHASALDGATHATCPATGTQCPACNAWFCNAQCVAGHASMLDAKGHPYCADAPATQCPACNAWFCNAQCVAGHVSMLDAKGHPCCADAPATQCPTCNGWYCNAQCAVGHATANADCGHPACPTTVVTCKGCNATFCGAACAACVAHVGNEQVGGKFNIRHQFVPGSNGQRRRQLSIEGPIRASGAAGRGSPPPPIASGQTVVGADTGYLKQFDNGHLVAIELDGEDDARCIVPMVRQFNRSPGSWRTMETNIVALIGGINLEDVDGGVVDATAANDPTTIDLSLRTANTVNATWQIEVHLFYHPNLGDPHVPVWLYVRVLHSQKVRAHFSMANRCTVPAAVPGAAEIAEYQLATDLFAAADDAEITHLTADDTRPMYVHPPAAGAPPYQILQYMEDVNDFAISRGQDRVFTSLNKLGQRGGQTPYDDEQRPTIRKFNRWLNNGALQSDVTVDGQYPDERRDLYAVLSECGSRSAPEVDHVSPSYQGGANLYINGRLVSFYHNHLYREKKERGSMPVNRRLHTAYTTGLLGFLGDGAQHVVSNPQEAQALWIYAPAVVVDPTTVASHLDALYADTILFNLDNTLKEKALREKDPTVKQWIKDRQAYLAAHAEREQKYAAEAALSAAYTNAMTRHAAAVTDFINNNANAERQRLLALIATAQLPDGSPLPLCMPSDVLLLAGGQSNPPAAGAPFVPVTPANAQASAAYTNARARYNAVKVLE